MQTVKMFGPSISDPTRIVNRDVPVADEQAYIRAGYRRGSIEEVSTPKPLNLSTEEVSLEDPEVAEAIAESPKPRKRKGQS
jgi:hypothetical protein